MRTATATAHAIGLRPTLWRGQVALSRVLRAAGRHREAETTAADARSTIQALAANLPDDSRAAFLDGALGRLPRSGRRRHGAPRNPRSVG